MGSERIYLNLSYLLKVNYVYFSIVMPGNGKGSSWRHCRLVTSRHATWSCLLSVGNALSTAYLLSLVTSKLFLFIFVSNPMMMTSVILDVKLIYNQ